MNDILNRYSSEVETTIQTVLNESSSFLQGVIGYHFGWVNQDFQPSNVGRGKMLRPTLHLLVFEALTDGYKEALPVAAAIEMIHNFSLLHDDIEDNGHERRGQPTAWTIWGMPRILNVGDFLYAMAFKSIHGLDLNRFSAEKVLAITRLMTNSCIAITEGQDLDIGFENLTQVSTAMYLDMVYKKTGALIEAAVVSGAMLATSDEHIIKNYYEFAHNIGIAFQIRDDLLGIWGDTTKTGKSTVDDLRQKKKTLPIIYTLSQVRGLQAEQLAACYTNFEPLSDRQIDFVRECLDCVGASAYAQSMAAHYSEKAFTALHKINIVNNAQIELESIAKFLVDREK